VHDHFSRRILDFLYSMPHITREQRGREWAARRLTDGTLFLVPDDEDMQQQGVLLVEWGGNPQAHSQVNGEDIAGLEIAEGVRRWIETGEFQDYKAEFAHLAQHFTVKTGGSISCGFDPEQEQWRELGRLIRKVGEKAALMALSRAL